MPPRVPRARASRPPRSRALRIAALVLGLAAGAPAAGRAQHPLPAPPPPFHVRLAEADAAVLVRVLEVEPGRLHVERTAALRGRVPERFAVKRAPSHPPALAAGDRAVLLLRGARPPYVLSDPATDAVRLADARAARRWRAALTALVAAGDDPQARLGAYLDWIDGGPATLAEAGLVGALAVLEAMPPAAAAEVAVARARAATDPARDPQARRLSALLAARTAEGAAALLGAAARGPSASPEVVLAALRAGARFASPGLAEAFARAAAHADPEVRLAAVQAGRVVAMRVPEAVEAALGRLATEDPEPGVRRRADRVHRDLVGAAAEAPAPPQAGRRAPAAGPR